MESHSAFVIVERFEEWPGELTEVLRGAGQRRRYVVRQVERFEFGTDYRLVVERLKRVVAWVKQTGRMCVLVVDEGGREVRYQFLCCIRCPLPKG